MSKAINFTDSANRTLNARVDVDLRGIVVHSRSGRDRNRDYREVVEQILQKLADAGISFNIYLDSAPVSHLPLESRLLDFNRTGTIQDQFNSLVGAMNDGSRSHGAWRRILLAGDGLDGIQLAEIISLGSNRLESSAARLPHEILRSVTPHHIDLAVKRVLQGETLPGFAESREYDLVTPNDDRLPPKLVFAFALSEALDKQVRPGDFTGGLDTPCFEMLEAAGYPIEKKSERVNDQSDPELAAAEGSVKLKSHLVRERNSSLAAAKKRLVIKQAGFLKCERCGVVPSDTLGPFGDAVIEVHHSKIRVADMSPNHVTRLADLVCLCANCHRIVHREIRATDLEAP